MHDVVWSYWYAPGLMSPYWMMHEVYPTPGDTTRVAHNCDADTDMGDLYGPEFDTYFPHAFEISQEQAEGRTITPGEGLGWSKLLRMQAEQDL